MGGKIYPYVVTPEELEPHLGVPVINTKAVGVSYAELMARKQFEPQHQSLSLSDRHGPRSSFAARCK